MSVLKAVFKAGELRAPSLGEWFPLASTLKLEEGTLLGHVLVAREKRKVVAPRGVRGVFQLSGRGIVQFGAVLGTQLSELGAGAGKNVDSGRSDAGFLSPMSGRYYSRPSPEAEAFVKEGDEVKPGQVIGLLEVMKTFNRIQYDGEQAKTVTKIAVQDGEDVSKGDVLLVFKN